MRVFTTALVAAACSSASAAAPSTWWSQRSPFNTPITRVAVDARSEAWAQMLYDSAGEAGLWINTDAWTTTVYRATRATPRAVISIRNTGKRIAIPYDPAWHPSPDADAHLAVIDAAAGCDYEFQEFDAATLSAHAEGTYRIYSGSGAHAPTGHTGGALSLLAGLVRPSDVQAGAVRHALAFAAPVTGPGAVSPATSSDGRTAGGPPEGTRFQLDPSLDLRPWHLSRFQLMIARALQRYGMYLRDTGGAVTLYAQSTSDGSSYSLTPQPLPRDLLLHLRAVQPPRGVSLDPPNPRQCARQR